MCSAAVASNIWLNANTGLSLEEHNNAGLTPLLSAANGGHAHLIQLLVERGAVLDDMDNDGYTPFLLTARRGFLNCVQLLAMLGSDMKKRTKQSLDALALVR